MVASQYSTICNLSKRIWLLPPALLFCESISPFPYSTLHGVVQPKDSQGDDWFSCLVKVCDSRRRYIRSGKVEWFHSRYSGNTLSVWQTGRRVWSLPLGSPRLMLRNTSRLFQWFSVFFFFFFFHLFLFFCGFKNIRARRVEIGHSEVHTVLQHTL